MSDFIFELISEEIPAKMQASAMRQLETATIKKVDENGIVVENLTPFVTPMRLGIILQNISTQGNESIKEIRGPRLGAPENAIEGFLKKNKIERNDLQEKETDKGIFYFYTLKINAQSLSNILAGIFTEIIYEFNWPKSMFWGDNYSLRWVRPLRGIVAVLFEKENRERVPINIRNIESGIVTRAHQVMHPEFFDFNSVQDYQEKILKGKVILQPEDRKTRVLQEGKKQAEARGFCLVEDDKLLEEIIGLTEFPSPILGEIPKELLSLPEEVIITSMREHQKFLSLRSSANGRVEGFLVVADLQTHDQQKTILSGNTRVLNSRLKDAIFFYQNDLKLVKREGIRTWNNKLKSVRFHEKLGSQYDRVERIAKIAVLLAQKFDLERDEVWEAATLIKADLVSSLVAEFPSLQGTMGAHYAKIAGCEETVSDAIRDHYLPVGSRDVVPKQSLSIVLALSDKIDYLTCLWRIGIKPTGNKDPFALRRTSLGIIRIILENKLDIDLDYLIDLTEVNFDKTDLQLFLKERIAYYLTEKNYKKKVVKAVVEQYELDLLPILPRVIAEITEFISSEAGGRALAVYKRVSNFLSSNKQLLSFEKRISKERATKEDQLVQEQLTLTKEQVEENLQSKDFKTALFVLGPLQDTVNQFLDNVQVNCEDDEIRDLRHALLSEIRQTMDRVLVFSELDKK
ncbi:glycine--tRNA ligase subunit beta [Paracoccaceae bacterium]|nr:glycine--tRNA ligase subunit beta [Paracoccaceae bacterium]